MSNCSDDYPYTEVLYSEIRGDTSVVVMIVIVALLTVIMLALFLEEIRYLFRVYKNDGRRSKTIIMLGLYPMLGVSCVVALLVPRATVLADLMASCYLSVCIYVFVTLIVDFFGGEKKMVSVMKDDLVRLNTPPCCCCCVCFPRVTLTRKSLKRLKLCAIQICIIRPALLFIAAILWTDGRYKAEVNADSAFIYISVLTAISTLTSIYGLVVLFRASVGHLRHQRLGMKFASLQILVVFVNLQNIIFSALARYDLPVCIGSRGSRVRGSNVNHGLIVMEAFLICWLGRLAYRRPDPDDDDENVGNLQNNSSATAESTGSQEINESSKKGKENPAFRTSIQ